MNEKTDQALYFIGMFLAFAGMVLAVCFMANWNQENVVKIRDQNLLIFQLQSEKNALLQVTCGEPGEESEDEISAENAAKRSL